MSVEPSPHVRLPAEARHAEIIEIKALISHPMETRQRRDEAGQHVPRKNIKAVVASFNGQLVFRAEWYLSISANPYQAFYFRAAESGPFEVV